MTDRPYPSQDAQLRAMQARMRATDAGYVDCPYTVDDVGEDSDCLACGEPADRHAPEDD